MKITKVCCQGCGADLEVDETIRYVTCNYCHARLEVVHDASVTHTRQLADIARNTGEMAERIKLLELQNDLERLDREWASRRETLLVRNKDGHTSVPSSAASIIGGIFIIGFGLVWIVFASSMGAPSIFPLFGIAFVGFAIFNMITGANKAATYQNLEAEHEMKRRSLIQRIEHERKP
ncbi:MAG: hypothetical protein V4640_14145 [Verrucomicrobiota bacterium]